MMADETPPHPQGVSVLNESRCTPRSKRGTLSKGDRFEVPVDGSVIDIVRGELLVEIQTRGFSALKRKLERLVAKHAYGLSTPSRLKSGSFVWLTMARWSRDAEKSPKTRVGVGAISRAGELPAPDRPPELSLECC